MLGAHRKSAAPVTVETLLNDLCTKSARTQLQDRKAADGVMCGTVFVLIAASASLPYVPQPEVVSAPACLHTSRP